MGVSKRHMMWVLTAAVLAFSTQIAQASGNNAGCCSTCCGHTPTHTVKIPNVTVMPPHLSISAPKIHTGGAMASATASASAYSSVDTSVSVAGGGGSSYMAEGMTIGMINGLTVQGAEVCTAASTRTTALVHPVQAVCLDDKGKAHPASRWTKDEIVDPKFAGEIYRCMAGTHLVATIGKVEAHKPVFDGGQTLACAKGEALAHNAGKLMCQTQSRQRDCNERSLLRRHGPGMKFITVVTTETIAPVCKAAVSTSAMLLDGGVGQ